MKKETITLNDGSFAEHALAFFGADLAEAGFSSVRTESGEFVYSDALKVYPLPAQRFRLFCADPIISGEVRRHQNLPGLGCAHIVATADGSRVFYSAGTNEPLREITLDQAVELLIDRRQALEVTA